MGVALDYTRRIAPSALKAAGAAYVCRYLSWLPNAKVILKPEYDELTAAGFKVLLNWEYDEHDWLSGAAGAKSHATEAVRQAKLLGHPLGWPIPGSADFDMTRAQWLASGKAYATTYKAVIHDAGYAVGGYGPWDVLQWLHDEVDFDVYWQSMSTSYSAHRNAQQWPGAHLWQRHGGTVGGVSVDVNDIIKEPVMALTQADADLIWNTKIGGAADSREAHFALSDLRDMLIDGKSSYTGRTYGAVADLSAKVDQVLAALSGGLVLTDAQVAAIAAAITNHPDTPLGPADEPTIVAAVKEALREGVGSA